MSQTQPDIDHVSDLLKTVEQIAPTLEKYGAEAEEQRRLSKPVVEAMQETGLLKLWVPKAFGGYEADPMAAFQIFEAVAKIDGAAGWNLQISTSVHPFLAWLPDEGPQEIYQNGPDVILGGALFPPGQATPVDGGYRLSGRWPFVSGCHHCDWYMAPSLIMDGDNPALAEDGQPLQILTFFSAKDTEILDTWHTVGMRGTGSHDVIAKEIFVPQHRTAMMMPLENPGKAYQGALYHMTIWPPVAALAPPALGIASAAIADLIDLAKKKTPSFTGTTLRERPDAQARIARAEAIVGAGRAYLHEALREGWETAEQRKILPLQQKLKIQMATIYAIQSSADAVKLIHSAAGSSAIRKEYKFQQYFRDVNTITQHAHASPSRYQSIGNLMFGLEMDWPFFAL